MARKQYEAQSFYLASGGNSCPRCGSFDIEGGFIETDSGIAWQKTKCNDCELRWRDLYTLTGISIDDEFVNPDGALKEVENG